MNRLMPLIILSLFTGFASSVQGNFQDELEHEADQKIDKFATQLKAALVLAIQKDGLQSAVQVCKEQAPQIAANLSNDNWTVARTSLKARNVKNQPDEWETAVLRSFDERYKAGEKASMLTSSQMENDTFRYMKAIPTGQLCLACHGRSVDPELRKSIDTLYPQDTAVGFTTEDIRGAFTLTKKLDKAL